MFLEITNEQINEAINKLIDGSINLGGKILGALIIFIIGKFIVIQRANRIKHDPIIALVANGVLFAVYFNGHR